jgi:thiamine biosynthesis lipoprotein
VEITVEAEADEACLDAWIDSGFAAIAAVEERMSRFRPDGDLGRLNGAEPGSWTAVHPSLAELLAAANLLFHRSQGVFDVRCGVPLAEPERAERPERAKVFAEPPVEIDGCRVRRTSSALLDLGGIAKGYAVDRATEAVRREAGERLQATIVNAGGDLRVWAREEQAVGLRIEGEDGAVLYPLEVREAAVATSAVLPAARRDRAPESAVHVRMSDGSRFEEAVTVTAIADRCVLADALTKIVMMASGEIARSCLEAYGAQALVFSCGASGVRLERTLP